MSEDEHRKLPDGTVQWRNPDTGEWAKCPVCIPTVQAAPPEIQPEMAEFDGGGVRSSDDGKPDFTLLMVTDVPYEQQLLTRAGVRMAEGAKMYGRLNHEKMNTPDALERCKTSLMRHVVQYLNGEGDEDHAAAAMCNLVMLSGIERRVEDA